jgi:hypothetical protein
MQAAGPGTAGLAFGGDNAAGFQAQKNLLVTYKQVPLQP